MQPLPLNVSEKDNKFARHCRTKCKAKWDFLAIAGMRTKDWRKLSAKINCEQSKPRCYFSEPQFCYLTTN